MTKQEFLEQLRKALSDLPQSDLEERLSFYGEMIEDRMEEGLSEEDAVAAVGTVPEIAGQGIEEIPRAKGRLSGGEIGLLILGAPLWLPLCIAAVAVIISLYVSLWSVIISLWAVFGSLVGCVFGCLASGFVFICNGNTLSGLAVIAAGLVCTGFSIFMYYGCKTATKGVLVLTRKLVIWIKDRFIRKGKVG